MDSSYYYNENAKKYFESTVSLDMEVFYNHFLKHIPSGGKILDAGCGSGRDTLAFIKRGFEVIAFDSSDEMIRMATLYTGQKILKLRFEELTYTEEFEGIWASASLLHLTRLKLNSVLDKLSHALKQKGAIYISFKYGTKEGPRDGRWFTDYTEELFSDLITSQDDLSIDEIWLTSDIRPGREKEKWLNVILIKSVG